MLLSHEVDGRIASRTQGAQELVIIEGGAGVDRLATDGTDSSLKNSRIVRFNSLDRHPRLTSAGRARE